MAKIKKSELETSKVDAARIEGRMHQVPVRFPQHLFYRLNEYSRVSGLSIAKAVRLAVFYFLEDKQ